MLEGIAAGFIFSLTLFPGTVWLCQIGYAGSFKQVVAVALAFWLSQLIWVSSAIAGLRMIAAHLDQLRLGVHLFAAVVLVYMSLKFFRAGRVNSLKCRETVGAPSLLFRNAFNQSLAMPMRLPAIMAILLSSGVYVNYEPTWGNVPTIMLGGWIGTSLWWGQLTFLSLFFVKRVPEPITLKSLNKIPRFCMGLCLCLALIVLLLGF
jgi:threonine/homoserine/homoserine lactone efflux protein